MKNFEELGVGKSYIKGLSELNILKPTNIQREVIPLLLNSDKDLIGKAQTGTGKTAAYGLPLLHKINPENKVVQGLILCPTRELSQQVAKQLFKFTKYTEKIFTQAVFGGEKIDIQISALSRPTHIIVATPGRLIDLVDKKAVDLSNVKTIVLDEADEMLSMGFKKELDTILSFVRSAKSKWLFSATIPHDIKRIIENHMSPDANRVDVSVKKVVNKDIKHQFYVCDKAKKFGVLMQMLKSNPKERGIIFCRTKATAKALAEQLIEKKVAADAIHGDMLQKERDKVMRAFKNERIRLLVATDLTARGIDIPSLAFVIHYQLPDKDEYYTHRSGRTARAGKEGFSMCLIDHTEIPKIRKYEKKLGISFKQIR